MLDSYELKSIKSFLAQNILSFFDLGRMKLKLLSINNFAFYTDR